MAVVGFSSGSNAQDAADADLSDALAQRSLRISEAVALALEGRTSDAEAVLGTSPRHEAESAAGRLELASRLVRVALECASNGRADAADSFASRALEHLESSRKLATERDAGVAASAWRLEGFVQLEFRGDRDAALAAYREALAVAPEDSQVRLRVERLENEKAIAGSREAEVTP